MSSFTQIVGSVARSTNTVIFATSFNCAVFAHSALANGAYCGQQPDGSFERCFNLGAWLGVTHVDPEGEVNGWSADDSSSTGWGVQLGQHFKAHWFWELSYADAGEAVLGNRNPALEQVIPDAAIEYTIPSLMLGYYLWEKPYGWNFYGKAGVSVIATKATDDRIGEEDQTAAQFALGGGVQYRFDESPWFMRLQLDSYDRDARVLSLRLSRFFGGPSYPRQAYEEAPARIVPVLVGPPKPVVRDGDDDGVINSEDQCPNTQSKTPVSTEGCAVFNAVLKGVQFESSKSVLTAGAKIVLNEAAKTLKQFPETNIRIEAHTDDQGAARYNATLSTARAQSVLEYLTGQGIAPSRMKAMGFGESKPIADNKSAEGRSKNRRVELFFD